METDDPKDADLVAQTLAGNPDSFGQLYDRYARSVRAVVAGVSGDWPAVDDMTQDCFLRAYRNLARLRDPQRFSAWAVGIARQVGRERRRSVRRDRHTFCDPQGDSLLTDQKASARASASRVSDQDEWEWVMRRLAELPEQERIAVHAFFLEEQHVKQAAALVGLSRSGFYALVQRAVARLARTIRQSTSEKS